MRAVATGGVVSHRRCTQRVSWTDHADHISTELVDPRLVVMSGAIEAYDHLLPVKRSVIVMSSIASKGIASSMLDPTRSVTLLDDSHGNVINVLFISAPEA